MKELKLSALSAADLDELIAQAALERARRDEPQPRDPPKEFDAVEDPVWFTYLEQHDTMLQIKHPGLGWLAFLLPPHERANLLSVLLRQALATIGTARASGKQAATSGSSTVH